jgi:hypothetical protein
MTDQHIAGIEISQLRVLVEVTVEVPDDAAVALTLDDGVLHARVDHSDMGDRTVQVVIDVGSEAHVLPGIRRRP